MLSRIAARWARMTGIPQEDFEQEIELWLLEHPPKDDSGRKMAAVRACQRMARKGFGVAAGNHRWDSRGPSELDIRKQAESDWTAAVEPRQDSPFELVAALELWKALALRAAGFRGAVYQTVAFGLVLGDDSFKSTRQTRHLVRYDFRRFLAAILADEQPADRYQP